MVDQEGNPTDLEGFSIDGEEAEPETVQPPGNRPATNAPQSTPGAQAQAWFPQEGATDFLGLEQDMQEQASSEIELPAAMVPQGPSVVDLREPGEDAEGEDSASWLLELDDAKSGRAGDDPIIDDPDREDPDYQGPETLGDSWSDGEEPKPGMRRSLVGGLVAVVLGVLGMAAFKAYDTSRLGPANNQPVGPGAGGQPAGSGELAVPGGAPQPNPSSTRQAIGSDGTAEPPIVSTPVEPLAVATPVEPTPTPEVGEPAGTDPTGTEPTGTAPTISEVAPGEIAQLQPILPVVEPGISLPPTTPEPLPGPAVPGLQPPAPAAPLAGPVSATEWLRMRLSRAAASGSLQGRDQARVIQRFSAYLASVSEQSALPAFESQLSVSEHFVPSTPLGYAPIPQPHLDDVPGAVAAGSEERLVSLPQGGNELVLPQIEGPLRFAGADDLAGIWRGSAIPVEAISNAERLLTPAVGRVRAVLRSGEVFEGRLYAVGGSQIWLETGIGRMALVGKQLARLDHLVSPDGTPMLGESGSEELLGLPRVRVRTPGGVFFGKVIDEDEFSVTLMTDEGARVTLASRDIEPANDDTRTVVVGKVEDQQVTQTQTQEQ